MIHKKAFAYCPSVWNFDFVPLDGELKGYVRVNIKDGEFFQLHRNEVHQEIDIPSDIISSQAPNGNSLISVVGRPRTRVCIEDFNPENDK